MSATRPVPGSNAVLSLLLVLACQAGSGPTDDPGSAALAKGGGGGVDPTVTAVDPTSAPQETTLDIRVIGTGYDDGSTARLLLDGKPVSTVKTNSTRFVSATELVANVTIALEAPVATYDVEVTTLLGRRKGIGSEMFEVKLKGNADLSSRAVWTFYPTLGDGITAAELVGDGRGTDGGASPVPGESSYEGGVCGVHAKIFNSGTINVGGDAVFDPDFNQPGGCTARVLRANLGAGLVSVAPYVNARFIWHMGENTQKVETMVLDPLGAPCGKANGSRVEYSVGNGSGVKMTRLPNENGVGVWILETTGNHLAACIKREKGSGVDTGLDVYLPFRARIVEIPAPPGGW